MAETIVGGAYQDTAGAWHDCNGKPLTEKQVTALRPPVTVASLPTVAAEPARPAQRGKP